MLPPLCNLKWLLASVKCTTFRFLLKCREHIPNGGEWTIVGHLPQDWPLRPLYKTGVSMCEVCMTRQCKTGMAALGWFLGWVSGWVLSWVFGLGPKVGPGMDLGLGPGVRRGMDLGLGPGVRRGMDLGLGPGVRRGMDLGLGPGVRRGMDLGLGPGLG